MTASTSEEERRSKCDRILGDDLDGVGMLNPAL
jgi:hypothetical protein